MKQPAHDLAPGYYWYSVNGDPYCVLHIHERGDASLMGIETEVSAADIAALKARGCRFFWIEPPVAAGMDARE